MKKLYITHPETNFYNIDPTSILLDDVNKLTHEVTYHTSVADLSVEEILSIIDKFDIIEYHNTNFDQNSIISFYTQVLLRLISRSYTIINFSCSLPNFINEPIVRPNHDKFVWHVMTGDPFENDLTGLNSHLMVNDVYTNLIQESMNIPGQLVLEPSCSISMLRNIIFNVPFSENDLLTIHLPHYLIETIYFSKENKSYHEDTKFNQMFFSPDYYTDDQYYFNYCTAIEQIVKYLRLKKIKFVMFIDMFDEKSFLNSLEKNIFMYLSLYPEFVIFSSTADTDDKEKNKKIADSIVKFLSTVPLY